MAESSQDQKLQISTDNSDLMSSNMDRTIESLDQSWELSQEITVKLVPIDEDESKKDNEQEQPLQYENVIVNLDDCMECHVQLSPHEIPKQNDDIIRQIHEYREEQETTPPNKPTSQDSKKDLYYDFEAFCHEK